jgi:hypothetical protein
VPADGCDPKDIALKSFFLGPQAENGPWVSQVVGALFESWFRWRGSRFPEDGRAISERDIESEAFLRGRAGFEQTLLELMTRFESELPKFSPRYIGHMFSEVSLPAVMGHIVALLHNPNNISGESSPVGTEIEDEAIAGLAKMIGLPAAQASRSRGHFTSGGTIANLEALMRARARTALWLSSGAEMRERSGIAVTPFEAGHMGWERFSVLPEPKDSRFNFLDRDPWE